jgi:hypothetical protein
MSAAAPLRRPAALRLPATAAPAREKVAHSRPRLVLISQRRPTAGRLPFLILVGAVLVAGLVGVLLLHMIAAQDAYRASTLQQQLANLNDQEQALANQVEQDSAPNVLRQHAMALGMRPAAVTHYKQLKDGRAIGVQTPVLAAPPASTTSTTDTSTRATGKTDKTATGKTGKTATGKTGTARKTATGKTGTAGKTGKSGGKTNTTGHTSTTTNQ